MAITFAQIDITDPRPGVLTEFRAGVPTGAVAAPRRILVLGTAKSGVTGGTGTIVRVGRYSDGHSGWGNGSPIGMMVETALLRHPRAEVYVLALSEHASGTAMSADLVVSGTATASGSVDLLVGGLLVRVPVTTGDASTVVAPAIATACGKIARLPVSATSDTSTATLTAKWEGESGNDVIIEVLSAPAGISVAAPAVTPGTNNPDATAAMAVLQGVDELFSQIACEWNDDTNLDLIEAELARRANANVGRSGELYVGVRGTKGEMLTWADSRNSQHVCAIACGKSPSQPWVFAADVAAMRASVSDPTISSLGLAMNAALKPATSTSARLSKADRSSLLAAGLSTYYVQPDETLAVERLVSTMTLDSSGNPTLAYQNIMIQEILRVIRADLGAVIHRTLGRTLVSDDKSPKFNNEISSGALQALGQGRILGALSRYFQNPKAVAASLVVEAVPENPNARAMAFTCDIVKELTLVGTQVVHS